MAIAHLHAGVVSRSAGRSSVDAAAYASRSRIVDERTGQVYDYSRKAGDVVSSFVWLPKDAPEHLRDRAALWNYAESRENRINSRTARTIETALPAELTPQQREHLAKDYLRMFTRQGIAVDASIHKPHSHGDQRNYHMHIVLTTRVMDAQGLGAKLRDLDDKATLQGWRDSWETLVNRHLERHGHQARIDMRSYAGQGVDKTPQIHVGQAASELERKGIQTDRGDQYRDIELENAQRGRAWTEGRARLHQLETVPVTPESAVDRQKRADQEERAAIVRRAEADNRRIARKPDQAQQGLMAAIWSLARTAGASLSHVILAARRGDLMQGRSADLGVDLAQNTAVPEARAKQAQGSIQGPDDSRQMVDRGSRAAPYRAMLGELRDNDREATNDSTNAAGDGAVAIAMSDRPAQEVMPQLRPETLLERIDRERRERGEVPLREVIGERSQDLERRLELERGGLEL